MIVGFLQNAWFLPSTKWTTIERYKNDPGFRAAVLAMSYSGKRLVRTFGDLYREIHWDNCTQEYGSSHGAKLPPDPIHIKNVLEIQKPDLVLAFGQVAMGALQPAWNGALICLPHPAARSLTDQLYLDVVKSLSIGRHERIAYRLMSNPDGALLESGISYRVEVLNESTGKGVGPYGASVPQEQRRDPPYQDGERRLFI